MIELLRDLVSGLLLAGGSIFLTIGAVGVLRFPDFYTRLHPAGITDTAGAGLILFGLMVEAGFTLVSAKLLLVLLLVVFTSPVSCHATARAAMASGLKPLLGEPRGPGGPPSKP
jgi:monovalent cation/proton antiporter MnhG/PhaG subunit